MSKSIQDLSKLFYDFIDTLEISTPIFFKNQKIGIPPPHILTLSREVDTLESSCVNSDLYTPMMEFVFLCSSETPQKSDLIATELRMKIGLYDLKILKINRGLIGESLQLHDSHYETEIVFLVKDDTIITEK